LTPAKSSATAILATDMASSVWRCASVHGEARRLGTAGP
jgi:hypothetical protein